MDRFFKYLLVLLSNCSNPEPQVPTYPPERNLNHLISKFAVTKLVVHLDALSPNILEAQSCTIGTFSVWKKFKSLICKCVFHVTCLRKYFLGARTEYLFALFLVLLTHMSCKITKQIW